MGFKLCTGLRRSSQRLLLGPEAAAPLMSRNSSSQALIFTAAMTEKCFSPARMEKKLLLNSSTPSSSEKEKLRALTWHRFGHSFMGAATLQATILLLRALSPQQKWRGLFNA